MTRSRSVGSWTVTFLLLGLLRNSAHMTPDGQTFVYSAAFDAPVRSVYTTRADSPESAELPYPDPIVTAVSPKGELAMIMRRRTITGYSIIGTLARASLSGGAPRDLLDDVQDAGARGTSIADWTGFGHAVMIDDACAGPEFFNMGACRGDAAAWFSGDYDAADIRGREIELFFGGGFGEADGVSRSAAEDGRARFEDGAQADGAFELVARFVLAVGARGRGKTGQHQQQSQRKRNESRFRFYGKHAIHSFVKTTRPFASTTFRTGFLGGNQSVELRPESGRKYASVTFCTYRCVSAYRGTPPLRSTAPSPAL